MSSNIDIDELVKNEYFIDKLISNKYFISKLRDMLKNDEKILYYDVKNFITSYSEYLSLDIFQKCYLLEHNDFDDYINIIIPNTKQSLNFHVFYFYSMETNDNVRKLINYLNLNEITILNIFECNYDEESIAKYLLTNYCDDINDLNNILKLIPKYLKVLTPLDIKNNMRHHKHLLGIEKMFEKINKIYGNTNSAFKK